MRRFVILVPVLVLVALASLSCGLCIAAFHPLSPVLAVFACLAATVFCFVVANGWLLLLPALLPVVDLSPWTGWISIEEFDIVVLGAVAGTYLRSIWWMAEERPRLSFTFVVIGSAFAFSLAIAFARGIADAGGFQFGWYQGYAGSMNSLRLAKAFFFAALFAPFMKTAVMRPEARGGVLLAWGMTLGLGAASLATVWERLAFPGLFNFSSDYRTTALFWEMHVGGAALDGFLALTMPFSVTLLLHEKRIPALVVAGLLFVLGVYGCLTTFSRGVYVAEIASFIVMAVLSLRNISVFQKIRTESVSPLIRILQGLAWFALALLCSYWVFRQGGYRSLGVVFSVFALIVAGGPVLRSIPPSRLVVALIFGVMLGLFGLAASLALPKGTYWICGGLVAMTAWAIFQARRSGQMDVLAVAVSTALFFAAADVSWYWGGFSALSDSVAVLLVVLGLAAKHAFGKRPLWTDGVRGQALLVTVVGVSAFVVVIFGGGKYMENRFSTTERDFGGRVQHWQAGLELLRTPLDWGVGKGLGRFPANFFFGARDNEFPGSYQIGRENDNNYLTLSGPRFQIGYGEVLRISQRIVLLPGLYHLELDSRAAKDAKLDLAICKKHLLYSGACASKSIRIPGSGELGWQHYSTELDARRLNDGAWYAPQLIVFTIALDTLGARIDVDNLKLVDSSGRSALINGGFSDDMARWFFTSDHHHMPWHMKNMLLHVLFEQGLLGVLLIILLVAVALLKTGRSQKQLLAPAMSAAIVGFMVVGLFDSLLDVPRVAFLFFLLIMMGVQSSRRSR